MGRRKKDYGMIEIIGNRLKEAIENKGLSVSQVAEKLNVSKQAVYYYLKGEREINLDDAAVLAEILDIPVSDLLTPLQKYLQNVDKKSTVLKDDGVFVDLLKSLNFDFFVDTDKDLKVRCHVGKKPKKVVETEANEILKAINDYYHGNKNGISESEFKELNTKFHQYIGSIPPTLSLTGEEWADLKDEIRKSVKDIVTRRIENIEIERNKFRTMLAAMYRVLDMIDDDTKQKAIECMSGLAPAADNKEAEKYASLLALQGFLKKYHYPE